MLSMLRDDHVGWAFPRAGAYIHRYGHWAWPRRRFSRHIGVGAAQMVTRCTQAMMNIKIWRGAWLEADINRPQA